MDTNTATYLVVTIAGIVYASLVGYYEAKKDDPTETFNVNQFVFSVLRAIPGIIAANLSLAALGLTAEGVIAAFMAGIGSDVVLKRSWRALKTAFV